MFFIIIKCSKLSFILINPTVIFLFMGKKLAAVVTRVFLFKIRGATFELLQTFNRI